MKLMNIFFWQNTELLIVKAGDMPLCFNGLLIIIIKKILIFLVLFSYADIPTGPYISLSI